MLMIENIDTLRQQADRQRKHGRRTGHRRVCAQPSKQPHSMFQNPQILTKKVSEIATLY
jgi:hypothetical protein